MPFVGAVAEARRHGRAAQAIFAQDIRALLAEPIAAARARMGIAEPQVFRKAHARLRATGIDIYRIGGLASAITACAINRRRRGSEAVMPYRVRATMPLSQFGLPATNSSR